MFDIVKVRDHLLELIGYQNTLDTSELEIDPNSPISTAESGIYYNDEFPLLELDNLRSLSPFQEGWNYDIWDNVTSFDLDQKVKSDTNEAEYYQSLVANNTGNPLTDTNSWQRIYPFSTWLERKTKAFINKFINDLVNQRKLKKYAKTLLSDTSLFNSNGRRNNLETKQGRFVGFKLRLLRQKNTQFLMDKVGFQFTATQTDLPIYVYHSSQNDPINVINITTTKTISFEWIRLDQLLTLEHWNDNYNTGGFFYIGYYEDDLNGQAINYNYDYDRFGCTSCNNSQARDYKRYARFLEARAFVVKSGNLNIDKTIWDYQNESVTTNKTFGLNFSFSVKCDLTDFLIKNDTIMLNSLLVSAKKWVCEEIINADRDNSLSDKMKSQALYNLSEEGADFKGMYDKELKSIDFDFSDLGSACCPAETRMGIRRGVV